MKVIKLLNSTEVVAVVDDEDFEQLNKYTWRLNARGYIYYCRGFGRFTVRHFMHRMVLNLEPFDSYVDHINGCKWDNRKENLRLGQGINVHAGRIRCDNTTGYKGVEYVAKSGKYRAVICIQGVRHRAGPFLTKEKEAAEAYKEMDLKFYGVKV